MPHNNIRTIARLSLVAAVAGSFGIAPVNAQEQASLIDAPLAPSPATPNALLKPLNFGASESKPTAGSGSAHARYSSAGWTYTAVAFNPANERIYAISTGDGGKEAGHLLRFQPNSKRVTDLGLLELDDVQADKIVSAAFTSRGQLVVFSGAKFRVLDLSRDFTPTTVTRTSDIEVAAHELKLEDGIGDIGLPSAWASVSEEAEADTLYAVSRSPEDEYFKWTLDVTTGEVDITQLEVAPNLRLDELGALNYAYTKDTATLVFADDKARSLEVVGDTIRASYFGATVVDNFRELSYLPTGAPYQPVTKFNPPTSQTSLASQPAVDVDAGASAPAADEAAPSLPTTVEDATEPTVSPNAAPAQDAQAGTDTQSDSDAQAGEDRDVKFTVMNERGHAVSGAGIEIVGAEASAKTDRNGQAALTVPGDDVLAMVDGEPVVINANESRIRVTLNSDSKTNAGTESTTTSATSTLTGTRSIAVVVQDNAGRSVAGATIEGIGEMAGKTFTSNSAGLAMVEVPASATAKTLTFTASKDGVQVPFDLSTDAQSATVQLSTNSQQSGSQQGGPQHRDSTILVRVVTDGGDPVQFAEVYSPGRPEVRASGGTDANGYVKVLVPANSGTSQTVRLAIRNAPSGYKTVDKQVNRYEDDVTLTLPRASTSTSSTKSKPDEVMEVVKEVEALMKELAGPAAIGGAFLRGQRGGASTTRSASATPLPLSGTATSTTSTTSTTGTSADSTPGASDSNVRMVNRTTSVSTTATPAPTRSLYNYDQDSSNDSDSGSSQSTKRSRDGDLANTGTPMTTVIVLGILAMLLGGAYLMISRRRER